MTQPHLMPTEVATILRELADRLDAEHAERLAALPYDPTIPTIDKHDDLE